MTLASAIKDIPIIITGMHRSGTSMITAYLENLGVNVGSDLMNADQNNPKGYFEDVEFLSLQRKMLIAGCKKGDDGHHDWGFTTGTPLNKSVFENYTSEARKIIQSREDLKSTWGWKDPRTSLMLDFWNGLIPNAYYILVFRNPWEVMRSMRNLKAEVFQSNPDYAFKIWKQYNEALLAFYKENKEKCILISANRFLQKPEALAELIQHKFKLEVLEEKKKDYSFYSGDLFYKELARDELKLFKGNKEIRNVLVALHKEADLTGYSREELDKEKSVTPQLSVVIPCYNQGEYLLEAVTSVERNLNDNYEIIIVNDGSNNLQTKVILQKLEDEGYHIIHQENKGLATARNVGIQVAKGKYILPLDADNRIDPEYINESIRVMENEASVGVVYGNCRWFGQQNGYRVIDVFKPIKLFVHNYIDACAVIRKSAFDECIGYDATMPVSGYEDWELWIHLHAKGWKFHHLGLFIFDYRVRLNSMLSKTSIPSNRSSNAAYIATKHRTFYEKNVVEIFKHFTLHAAELELIAADRDRLINEFNNYRTHLWQSVSKSLLKKNYILGKEKLKLIRGKFFKRKLSFYNFFKLLGTKEGNRKIKRKVNQILHKFLKLTPAFDLLNSSYRNWRIQNVPSSGELQDMQKNAITFSYKPLISIITPTYNSEIDFLEKAYHSLKEQVYSHWEWCIADDYSTKKEVRDWINAKAKEDQRVKYIFRKENGHISLCSNDAIQMAKGEFIVLLDHDDELAPDALYEVALYLQEQPDVDFFYSDEDKINASGKFCEPHFKPDYCPDNLLSRNYITHMACIRASLVNKIGGFRAGFDGSQDYDLFLRVVEQTNKIVHLPKVLYHWRMHKDSVAKKEDGKVYAFEAGEKAVNEALQRRGENGSASKIEGLPGYYSIRYQIQANPKVSIIIPTKDQTNILKKCIDSIISISTYSRYELIIINNNSSDPAFFHLMKDYEKQLPLRFSCIDVPIPFNYSKLINAGAEAASGDFLLLLNNDTEVITPDWIEAMLEQAQRNQIGAVGVKLLYPNKTIQHAGVVIGLGGVAGHTFIGKERDDFGYYFYIQAINNYSSVTAACLMISKNKFNEVGGFEVELAVEYNDVDFCLKMKKAGYDNIYLPHVELFHYESLTRGHPHKSKESYDRHVHEIGIFKARWNSYIQHDPCYSPNLSLDVTDFQIRR